MARRNTSARVYRPLSRDRVGDSFQFEPHRCAPDRPEARVGARGRWRGRAASVEHSRQSVCGRRGRFHRRHAGDSRPRWPEPWRLRLPGDDHRGGLVADRSIEGRATRCASCPSISRRPAPPRKLATSKRPTLDAQAAAAPLAAASVHATAALVSPIVLDIGADRERLVARLSGDTHLLLEIGPPNSTSSCAFAAMR